MEKPGDTGRFQLDFFLVRQRYRNSVKNACSYPGADADTDHNLIVMSQVATEENWKDDDDVVLRHTLPVFTGLGRCPIVSWDFAAAVSIFEHFGREGKF